MSTNLLERLSNAIATAVNPTAKNMTRDEFITYATEQVIAIAGDVDKEVAKARLSALDKARTEARKFDEHSTVRISIFDPAALIAERSETMQDPPASGERKDSAPEAGLGEAAGKTSTTKSLGEVVVDLEEILNPPTAEQIAAKAEAAKLAADKAAADKAAADKAAAAAEAGKQIDEDEEEEDEDEDDKEAAKAGEEVVDESIESNLFPHDMNEHRRTAKGRLVRKRSVWGDDPVAVRGVS